MYAIKHQPTNWLLVALIWYRLTRVITNAVAAILTDQITEGTYPVSKMSCPGMLWLSCSHFPLLYSHSGCHVSNLCFCLHPFIQMRQMCLRCPFSFGYPSEQSLWTAYPFTAINNSLPLPPSWHHRHYYTSSCSSSLSGSGALLSLTLSLPSQWTSCSALPAPAYNLTGTDVSSTVALFISSTSHSPKPALFPPHGFHSRWTIL